MKRARTCTEGLRTRRVVNPLEPVYDLPSFQAPSLPSTKFVRDSFCCKDINGKPKKKFAFPERTNYVLPQVKKVYIRANNPTFVVKKQAFHSRRCVDPLVPEYQCHFMQHGKIEKSVPRRIKSL
eukprot:snap_masked-scaffold_25-processed-gene-5.3-mRNA-1 protein AED:1.00 eAED:1.00 QI:0/-1/0/0/-1/1/1/0/123